MCALASVRLTQGNECALCVLNKQGRRPHSRPKNSQEFGLPANSANCFCLKPKNALIAKVFLSHALCRVADKRKAIRKVCEQVELNRVPSLWSIKLAKRMLKTDEQRVCKIKCSCLGDSNCQQWRRLAGASASSSLHRTMQLNQWAIKATGTAVSFIGESKVK